MTRVLLVTIPIIEKVIAMDVRGIKESHFDASALKGLPAEAIEGRGI